MITILIAHSVVRTWSRMNVSDWFAIVNIFPQLFHFKLSTSFLMNSLSSFFIYYSLDIFHWKCLNEQQSQLPPNTAAHGRTCPVCRKEIFPSWNLVSPVAEALKKKVATTNWGRQALGLALVNN